MSEVMRRVYARKAAKRAAWAAERAAKKAQTPRAIPVPLNTELGRTSRERCHLPLANYMKLRVAGDSSLRDALFQVPITNLLSRSCRPWAHSRKNCVYLVPRLLTPRGL
jgi:hypothetical protein